MSKQRIFVATLIPQKKLDKICFKDLAEAFLKSPLASDLLQLFPETALSAIAAALRENRHVQPLLIVHKIGDYPDDQLDSAMRSRLLSMEGVRWIDCPEKAAALSCRWVMYKVMVAFISQFADKLGGAEDFVVDVPPTVLVESGQTEQRWEEDSVLKPVDACGDHESHQMIFLPANVSFACPTTAKGTKTTYIRQAFIEHGGWMYKLYVIGENVSIVPRRSLQWHHSTHTFSSQQLKEQVYSNDEDTSATTKIQAIHDRLEKLAIQVSQWCGLSLLGIDVIVGDEDGVVWMIDLNYFPGYDSVEDVPSKLAQCILLARQ